MKIELLASLAMLASTVAAGTDYIGNACLTVAQTYNFSCVAETGGKGGKGHGHGRGSSVSPKCLCSKPAFLETIVGCKVLYGDQKDPKDNSDFTVFTEFCSKPNLDLEQYVDEAQDLKPLHGNPKRTIVTQGILLNQTAVVTQANASHTADRMSYYDMVFACAPIAYFFGILLIKTFFNMMQKAAPGAYQRLITIPVSRKLRKYVLLPATFSRHHSAETGPRFFSFCIPQRIETLIVAGYVIMSVVVNFACIWPYYPNTRLTTDRDQWAKFIGRRSGYTSLGAYDLVLLFAGRNNFWLWLTGWPLDTFNIFHRWTGRVAVFHVMVHSIAYGVLGNNRWSAAFMQWGVVGTVLFGLLFAHSFKYLRSLGYETFFVIHIVLAVFAMPATWIHIRNSGIEFCYAGVAIWAFDHVARLARIALSGINAKANVQLVNDEIIRLEIDYSRAWKWYPGCYVFVHLANRPLEFWQSHPFTALPMTDAATGKSKILLLARVRKGITKKLARELAAATDMKKTIPVLIDGPYGHKAPMHQYNTAILIAGGVGITAPLAHALELVEKQSSKTERILFVWAVRSHQGMSYASQELARIGKDPRVEIQLYFTQEDGETPQGSTPSSDSESICVEKNKDTVSIGSTNSSRSYHRPDLFGIISQEIQAARGSVAVMVCGPGPMNDDVRSAIVKNVDTGVKIDYFEEAFAW